MDYSQTTLSTDTVTLSSSDVYTVSSSALGAIGSSNTHPGPYIVNTSNGTSISNPWGPTQASAKIQLNGEGADIEVNGKSLMTLLESIEQRLNILTPNPKLESEWNELRELGDRYRELEAKCLEKTKMWKQLKS